MNSSVETGRRTRRERKALAFAFDADAEEGEFEGYASVFNVEDNGRDIVAPGAFRRSLRARGVGGVKLLFQHDAREPIGVWRDMREDGRGLYVRGRLLLELARARDVLALMRAGALNGLSIGYQVVRARTNGHTGVRTITDVDLWEVSIVTFPLLNSARITRVKRRQRHTRIAAAEQALAAALRARAVKCGA